jgi:protease II
MAQIPFIPKKLLKKSFVQKLKMSDDHNIVGFTIDVGNTEILTGGFKDMTTGKILSTKLERVGGIEFGTDCVFFTECDD